jgi:hypothetical protein
MIFLLSFPVPPLWPGGDDGARCRFMIGGDSGAFRHSWHCCYRTSHCCRTIFFVPLIIQLLLHLFFVPAWLGQVEHLSEIKGIQHQNLEF